MGIPIIIVLISLVAQTNALLVADQEQNIILQTGQPYDAQLIGQIGSGGTFGVDGFLPAIGPPLLGLLLLLGLAGGATVPSTPCPPCSTLPTTACPPPTVCTPVPGCPPGFERLGSPNSILTKCYRVTGPVVNYMAAEGACYAVGGILTQFNNADEAAAVQAFSGGLTGPFYVGYRQFMAAGDFIGTNSNATPVGVVFPDNIPGVIDCARFVAAVASSQECIDPANGGICEARIDPAAVSCVCA